MKKKPYIPLILIIVAVITVAVVLCVLLNRPEPMYYHRNGYYEIAPDGTVTLLTEEPISTIHEGVVYSLFENAQSFGIMRNDHTYLEMDLYYPEDDVAHRPQLSPCGLQNLLTYANYNSGSKLFYPFLSLEDEQIHLACMDDNFDSFGLIRDFAVGNAFLSSCDDKLYFLLDHEDGYYPARLDWEVGDGPKAIQLSDISANINPLRWIARDQFWWVHHDQETGSATLCYVPLSSGETTQIEIPDGYSINFISENYIYYHHDGVLEIYSFRKKSTETYFEFPDYSGVCAATNWGALIAHDGEAFYLLLHDSGEVINLDMMQLDIETQYVGTPEAILSEVYGEHFWVDEEGNYNSLLWPDNTELGVCNLDMTEKHAVLDRSHFSLTSDKAVYSPGESPVLTLTAHTSGGFGWEYDIEQEIGGRWYWLNSMAGWEATVRTMEPGDQIEIEVNPRCGWYQDGIPQYQLASGAYRIVVQVMIETDQPEEYDRAYVACDILIQ